MAVRMSDRNPGTRFARQQANRLLTGLGHRIGRARRSATPAAVHDLRVAIRRFLQVLNTLEPAFPAQPRKKIRRKLKRLMEPAGQVRNCDVAAELIGKLDAQSARRLRRKIRTEREEAERRLTGALRGWAQPGWFEKWRTRLDLHARRGSSGSHHFESVEHMLKKLTEDFLKAGEKASDPDATARRIHGFRIAAKEFRYSLELLEPLRGARLAPWLDRVKAVQSILGDVNDCETVGRMAAQWGAGEALLKKIERRQRRKIEKFRREWAQMRTAGVWPSVTPAKPASSAAAPRRPAAFSSSRAAVA